MIKCICNKQCESFGTQFRLCNNVEPLEDTHEHHKNNNKISFRNYTFFESVVVK